MSGTSSGPWHVPEKWHAVPAFWEPELQDQFDTKSTEVRMLDCTFAEGPDCAGASISWKYRIELAHALDEAGVGFITTPGGCSVQEEKDWIKTLKREGLKAKIVNKLAGFAPPLAPGWKDRISRQVEIGGDILELCAMFDFKTMVADFDGSVGPTKQQMIDAIHEVVPFAKSLGMHVNFSHLDQTRCRMATSLSFYQAAADAGADSFYIWDSRGNCNPLTAYFLVKKIRKIAGDRPIAIQFHNDFGMATGNSFAAAMAGANWLDCSVLGIADRGGAVALEEIACALEVYGVKTGIDLEKLYSVAQLAEKAFSVETQIWKPIVGRGSFAENGWGHRDAGDPQETSAGIAPNVVGRGEFRAVLGGRVFSDRDSGFWTDVLDEWGYEYTPQDVEEIKGRTRDAIISRRGLIELDEYREICDGVLGRR